MGSFCYPGRELDQISQPALPFTPLCLRAAASERRAILQRSSSIVRLHTVEEVEPLLYLDGKLENFETGFEERLLIISQCSVRTLRNVPSVPSYPVCLMVGGGGNSSTGACGVGAEIPHRSLGCDYATHLMRIFIAPSAPGTHRAPAGCDDSPLKVGHLIGIPIPESARPSLHYTHKHSHTQGGHTAAVCALFP